MRRAAASLAPALLLVSTEARPSPPPPPPRPPGPTLELATDPEHPGPRLQPGPSYGYGYEGRRYRRNRSDVSVGAGLALGRSRQTHSEDGTYGRLAFQLQVYERRRGASLIAGGAFLLGGDFWKASNGWGLGLMPMDLQLGYGTPHVLVRGSLGVTMFTVDRERGETGVGLLAPHAGGNIGLDIEPIRILFDARIVYRWHFATPDTPQRQIGLLVELYTR